MEPISNVVNQQIQDFCVGPGLFPIKGFILTERWGGGGIEPLDLNLYLQLGLEVLSIASASY